MYLEGVYEKKESEFCLICLLSFDFKNSHSISFGPSSERVIEKHCATTYEKRGHAKLHLDV